MIDLHMRERVARHPWVERIGGVLDDSGATARLDRQESGGPVVQGAREDQPDHPGRVLAGGAAEQRVDGRPVTVLARPAGEVHVPAPQQDMVIGRGDVDAPGLDRLAVLDMGGRQRAMPAQDFGQGAGPSRRQVEDHEHGRGEIARQRGGQVGQRIHTAGGGADDHDAVVGHEWPPERWDGWRLWGAATGIDPAGRPANPSSRADQARSGNMCAGVSARLLASLIIPRAQTCLEKARPTSLRWIVI